jgi:3-dehydroquinate synthase
VRARGVLIWLQAPAEVLAARIAADEAGKPGQRPLAQGGDLIGRVRALLDARWACYDQAHLRVDTAELSPDGVVDELAERLASSELATTLPPVTRSGLGQPVVRVELGQRSYEIVVDRGFGSLAVALVNAGVVPTRARTALVADANALRHHGAALLDELARQGLQPVVLEVPSGEAQKTLSQLERLADGCVGAGLDRGAVIFAFGGGVVGDLAGFLAATLHRGVRVVQLPTTLLAQVDAAIGGKTAVDLAGGKNLLGAFHQPRLVYSNVSLLATLPRREVASGLGEVVKYGLIADPEILTILEGLAPQPLAESAQAGSASCASVCLSGGRGGAALEDLVGRCAAIKARVVSNDEHERGDERRTLNFGHTVGHAIEASFRDPGGGFELAHGEAVGLGMLAAIRVSAAVGTLADPDLETRVRALLAHLGLPCDLPPYLGPLVRDRLGADKKRAGDDVDFVCIERAGVVSTVRLGLEALRRWLLEWAVESA